MCMPLEQSGFTFSGNVRGCLIIADSSKEINVNCAISDSRRHISPFKRLVRA